MQHDKYYLVKEWQFLAWKFEGTESSRVRRIHNILSSVTLLIVKNKARVDDCTVTLLH